MKQGILLVATGHPYYGRMAYNLAATIKATGTIVPVAVIHDENALSHLNEQQLAMFNKRIKLRKKHKDICSLRMDLHKLTPFDQTMALDVDMLWFNTDPMDLFSLLNDRDFTIVNEGYKDLDTGDDHTSRIYTYWSDLQAIIESHGVKGRFYQVRGEFLLFNKTDKVAQLYDTAKKILLEPKVKVDDWANGVVPDEFALNIALNLHGIEPHAPIWQPAIWPGRNRMPPPPLHIMNKQYHAISFGGNVLPAKMRELHDLIAKAAFAKLGLPFEFTIQPKRHYLTERLKN